MKRNQSGKVAGIPFFVGFGEFGVTELHSSSFGDSEREAPLVKSRAKRDAFLFSINFPLLPELRLRVKFDQSVEIIDNPNKLSLNLLRRKSQLPDQTVNFVYEKKRFHPFCERLTDNRFGLSHYLFNRVNDHDHGINRPQRPCHLSCEIHVTRRVHQIDQVHLVICFMQEGYVRSFDRDSAPLFLLQVIQRTGRTSHLHRQKTGFNEKRVGHSCFSMINMRDYSDVADALFPLHQFQNFGCLSKLGHCSNRFHGICFDGYRLIRGSGTFVLS